MPRAHSSSAGGSCRKPSTVLRTIGSSACRKSATSAGGFPTPSAIIARAMIASVGIAVTMFKDLHHRLAEPAQRPPGERDAEEHTRDDGGSA